MKVTAKFTWTKSVSANAKAQNLVLDGVENVLDINAESFEVEVAAGHHAADLFCFNDHVTSPVVHVEFDAPDVTALEAPSNFVVNVEVA
jgi:hypothetical protein